MATAKDILVKPITAAQAAAIVKRVHYSGKVVQNSQLHLGVFLNGVLEGAMQFGPSMDKRKVQGLVRDTGWNNFIELNRMAFSDRLPRNSESRALSVAFRLIKKHYPHIEWIISFSDGTQCGDGTIYRAAGFVLTGIRENKTLYEMPDGSIMPAMTLEANWDIDAVRDICARVGVPHIYRTRAEWVKLGAKPLPGYQMRYIYFLNPDARKRLTVPELPFADIDRLGAGMYRGERISIQDRRDKQAMAGDQSAQRRGSTDRHAPNLESA
jgi:hypothetical protein